KIFDTMNVGGRRSLKRTAMLDETPMAKATGSSNRRSTKKSPNRKRVMPLGVKSQEVVHPSLVWKAGGCEAATLLSQEARMNIHQPARTTPRRREALVHRIARGAESGRDVAEALGVSERTVRKWAHRYRTEGV